MDNITILNKKDLFPSYRALLDIIKEGNIKTITVDDEGTSVMIFFNDSVDRDPFFIALDE